MEFFAELSQAYFGVGTSFPHTRDELKEFDPSTFRVIADAWEQPSKLISIERRTGAQPRFDQQPDLPGILPRNLLPRGWQ
jgi:hypothetical protein